MSSIPEQLQGDGPCHDCGGPNIVWFTDSDLWNLVMGGPNATDDPGGILCVPCFAVRAGRAGVAMSWKLEISA